MADVLYWIGGILAFVYVHGGWLLYFRERGKTADLLTDLTQNIHYENIGRGDLRRALGYDAIERYLGKKEESDSTGLVCLYCMKVGFETREELEDHIENHDRVRTRGEDDG